MAAPRWTAEWRGDVRELIACLDKNGVDELQVESTIRQLYAHSYLDCNPSAVKATAWGLIEALQFHHRDRHAERLAEILFDNKMGLKISPEITSVLLALSTTPSALTEADLDDIDNLRKYGQSMRTRADEDRARAQAATKALVEDLNRITLEDDWFQGDASSDEAWTDDEETTPPQPPPSAPIKRSGPRQTLPAGAAIAPISIALPPSNDLPVPAPLEVYGVHKPWLFYKQYMATNRARQLPGHMLAKTVVPEALLVEEAFSALLGVPSTTFARTTTLPASLPYIAQSGFWQSLSIVQFELSVHGRSLAVSHLSPSSLHGLLLHFADAASSLAFVDAIAAHFGRLDGCTTLQGFAHALREWTRGFRRAVVKLLSGEALPSLLQAVVALEVEWEELQWLFDWTVALLTPALAQARPAPPALAASLLSGLQALLEQYAVLALPRPYQLLLTLFETTLTPFMDAVYDYVRGLPLPLDVALSSPAASAFDKILLASIGGTPAEGVEPPAFLSATMALVAETHAYSRLSTSLHMPTPAQAPATPSSPLLPRTQETSQLTFSDTLLYHTPARIPMGFAREVVSPPLVATTIHRRSVAFDPALPLVSFKTVLDEVAVQPLRDHCLSLGQAFARQFVTDLRLCDHLDTLRWFVLQQQVDASVHLTTALFAHLLSPVHRSRWLEPYTLNLLLQETLLHAPDGCRYETCTDNLSLQVAPTDDKLGHTGPSIAWLEQIQFTYTPPSPLHLVFREETVRKYSVIGIFSIQLQGVERQLVQFKHRLRHRVGYFMAKEALHPHVIRLAEMLHFVESLHGYVARATSEEQWADVKATVELASRVSEMSDAIEKCLQRMLERCFLAPSQRSVHRYIVQLLHHIVMFVADFDRVLQCLERGGRGDSVVDDGVVAETIATLVGHATKFALGHHFLHLMLESMFRTGSAPHLHHLMLDLNFNEFYAENEG
ncbi:hypothetical protein ACHHYP_12834 [Achlya hypogyna]|uniref:Spindle pole body component n=1 Tax=Achlya hypogyna TaxID=1202772 RepID=A0A1V9YGB4_ACHHY|nr:hypothetical protein ACHHYP_12834 [Achlya hypogyna]